MAEEGLGTYIRSVPKFIIQVRICFKEAFIYRSRDRQSTWCGDCVRLVLGMHW